MRSNFKGFQKSNRSVFNDKCFTDKMREKNSNKHNIHLIRCFADSFESLKQKSQVLPEHSQLCFSFVTITHKKTWTKRRKKKNELKALETFLCTGWKNIRFCPCIFGFRIFCCWCSYGENLVHKLYCIQFSIRFSFPSFLCTIPIHTFLANIFFVRLSML